MELRRGVDGAPGPVGLPGEEREVLADRYQGLQFTGMLLRTVTVLHSPGGGRDPGGSAAQLGSLGRRCRELRGRGERWGGQPADATIRVTGGARGRVRSTAVLFSGVGGRDAETRLQSAGGAHHFM